MAESRRGQVARDRMIEAAERLVAERGLEALSLREVAAQAGQRNHSAVQYHFGSKEALVAAVFETRMAPIEQRRHQLLEVLDAEGSGRDVRRLVEVAVLPLAEAVLVDPPGWYGRFVAEVLRSAPDLLGTDRPTMASLTVIGARLTEVADDVPPRLRAQRIDLAFRFVAHSLADQERAAAGSRRPVPPTLAGQLVDLMVAMLEAPVSASTLAAQEAREG